MIAGEGKRSFGTKDLGLIGFRPETKTLISFIVLL